MGLPQGMLKSVPSTHDVTDEGIASRAGNIAGWKSNDVKPAVSAVRRSGPLHDYTSWVLEDPQRGPAGNRYVGGCAGSGWRFQGRPAPGSYYAVPRNTAQWMGRSGRARQLSEGELLQLANGHEVRENLTSAIKMPGCRLRYRRRAACPLDSCAFVSHPRSPTAPFSGIEYPVAKIDYDDRKRSHG